MYSNKVSNVGLVITVAILVLIALMVMPLAIFIDLIVILPIIFLYLMLKRSLYSFLISLAVFGIIANILMATTDLFYMSALEYKYHYIVFIKEALSPYLWPGGLRFVLKMQMKSFDWCSLTSLILPGFLIYRYKLWEKISLFDKNRVVKIPERKFKKYRNEKNDVLIGIDKNDRRPFYLSESERLRHVQVLGATGFGKTESALMSMIENDIQTGKGLILLDAKGDDSLFTAIHNIATDCGRSIRDIKIFNPALPKISHQYNPLAGFNDTYIMNKVIGSLDWTEPYYKKMSQMAVLQIAAAYSNLGEELSIHKLYMALKDPHSLLEKEYNDPKVRSDLQDFCAKHEKQKADYSGLIADLGHLCSSDFGGLMRGTGRQIQLMKSYKENDIVLFQISTLKYPETARIFGKILLRDIAQLCGDISSNIPSNQRQMFPIYIDEFASFAYPEFAEVLRMSRSSGVSVTMSHQSLGDLDIVSPAFKQQIMSNANIKIILKVNDHDTIDEAAKMTGTKETFVHTFQVNRGILRRSERTGVGTEVSANEFNIHPRVFRNMSIVDALCRSIL